MSKGAVVVSSATLAPDVAEQLGARLDKMGLLMIDAPVSGGAAKAAAGEMTIMASGAPEAFAKCGQVFDAIAAKVYRLGDRPGPGSKVKMINQLLAGVHIAAACEAMALAVRAGADPKTVYEVICNSAGSSWMFQNRVPHILAGDYTPLSAVNIFVKDLGIVLDTAKKFAFPLPLTAAAHQLYLAAAAQGHGLDDDASVVKVYAALAGLDLPAK
jgi:L-threonate 2-dehydrogenase